ncbi:MAG: capsule assembly Wzi family protein, partial [Marinagarivorans sp.]|nr:capsule assembly Wzi family protein [Marinagarivorans sp.]
FEWWSLGATRMFQFGGGEREVSAKTLARAFYDPRGSDNDASVDEESGNQLASLYSRLNFTGQVPFSIQVELGGEDTSNNKDYQLGNPSFTAGIYFPFFFSDAISLGYEASNWDQGWYVNNVYQKGYSHKDLVLGHWGMQDQHIAGTAVAGSSQALHLTWLTSKEHSLNVELMSVEHDSAQFSSAWNLDVEYEFPVRFGDLGVGVFTGKNSFGDNFLQLRVFTQWP